MGDRNRDREDRWPTRREGAAPSRLLRRGAAVASAFARSRHATILCFHGVAEHPPRDPGSVHVTGEQFLDTIEMARDVAEPVPLGELTARQAAGRSTGGLFAVTFDDAYASLAAHEVRGTIESGLPVTAFVVSDASARGSTFWWDRLEAVQPLVATDTWRDFERAIGLPDAYHTPAAATFGPLRALRQWILREHAGRWPQAADAALRALERETGAVIRQRAMTHDELDDFTTWGRVELGVHSATHPVLPLLGDDEVLSELRTSYAALRERWPATLPWVAVPFGLYDDRTSRLTREAGLDGMLTVHPHTLAHASPTHGLPRMNIMQRVPQWKVGLRLGAIGRFIARPRGDGVRFPDIPHPD